MSARTRHGPVSMGGVKLIYTLEYPKGKMRVDTDRIAKIFLNGGQLFVRFFSKEDRIKLIEFLESEGFACEENGSFSRQSTIDTFLPLVINVGTNRIRHMGSVTGAAAVAGSGEVMSDRDFYLLYSLHSLKE